MKYGPAHRAIAMTLLCALLAGCVSTGILNDVPPCERLIPGSLLTPVEPVDLPDARKLSDGHDDAQPWQEGFVGQTGRLEEANGRAPTVDHIYRECLRMHREALQKEKPLLERIFGD